MTGQASPAARGLLGKLGLLRKQTANIIGELYARTAGTLMTRLETIEDRAAQRRLRRHDKPAASSPPVPPAGTSEVESPSSTPKTSV